MSIGIIEICDFYDIAFFNSHLPCGRIGKCGPGEFSGVRCRVSGVRAQDVPTAEWVIRINDRDPQQIKKFILRVMIFSITQIKNPRGIGPQKKAYFCKVKVLF